MEFNGKTMTAYGEFSGGGGGSANAVLYTPQELTEEQKAQARENIGVPTLQEIIYALPVYNGEVV